MVQPTNAENQMHRIPYSSLLPRASMVGRTPSGWVNIQLMATLKATSEETTRGRLKFFSKFLRVALRQEMSGPSPVISSNARPSGVMTRLNHGSPSWTFCSSGAISMPTCATTETTWL